MDEKHLETKNGRNFSDSCEEKDEEIEDIATANSSELSLEKKCVSEASAAEDYSSYENCNTRSDEMGDKSCTALYAESGMNQSDTTNTYENSPCEIQDNHRAFKEIREQLGYSSDNSDNSGSDSSTVDAGEEDVSPPNDLENCYFRKEFANSNLAYSCGNSTIDSHALDIPMSSCIIKLKEIVQCYLADLYLFDEITETIPQTIMAHSKEYECASLPNTAIPSSNFPYGNVRPYASSREVESLTEDVPCIEYSENNIHGMHAAQCRKCSFLTSISSNESDESDFPEMLKNNNPVLKDISEIEQSPKTSPTDNKSVGEKSQKDISELIECSKLSKCNASARKKVSSLNSREGINQCLDIPSTNKENHPNETELNQNRTFKRSLSDPTTEGRGSKFMKPSSAESPTRILRNVDNNLTKRPAPPDDKLSPEIHIKRQKREKNLDK